MLLAAGVACSACGRENPGDALVCGLCGAIVRGVAASSPAAPIVQKDSRPWIYLGIGALTAPIFGLTPLLGYMGWFLGSLVHEMGHCAAAWFLGMPAFPAISLEGHAVAVHSERLTFLTLAVWAALFATAWRRLAGPPRWTALAAIAVVYPALAFTRAGECLHLLAGHGGELAFATLCLWKALDGGFTDSRLERALYGTLGWFLLGSNALLCFGLISNASSRAEYAENGSFGLTNDLLRVADEILGSRLQAVAFVMLLASLAVLPAALGLWRLSSRSRES